MHRPEPKLTPIEMMVVWGPAFALLTASMMLLVIGMGDF